MRAPIVQINKKVLAIIYKALVITNEEREKNLKEKKLSLIKSRWKQRSRKSLADDIRIPRLRVDALINDE